MGNAFNVDDLLSDHDLSQAQYLEFIRKDSMSVGVYQLPKNGVDLQQPHSEDEVYFVLAGKAKLQINELLFEVQKGSVLFVEAFAPHKFIDIEEDLVTIVFFAPAENSQKLK